MCIVVTRACGSGHLRPRSHAVETLESPQLQKPRQSSPTHACACRACVPALTFAVATQTAFNLYIYI